MLETFPKTEQGPTPSSIGMADTTIQESVLRRIDTEPAPTSAEEIGLARTQREPIPETEKSPGVSIDESQEEIYSSPLLVPVESGVRSKQAEEVFSMRVKGGEPTPGDLSKPPFTRSIDEISEEEKAA